MDNGINSSSSPKVSSGSFTDPSRSSTVSVVDAKITATARARIFTPPTVRFGIRGRVKLFLKEETFEEVLSHAKNGKVRSTFTFFGPATKKPYTEILAQALCKKAKSNEFEGVISQLSAHINKEEEDGNFGFILKATIQAALKEPTILETLLNTSQTDSESLLNEILDGAKGNPAFRNQLFCSDSFKTKFNTKTSFQGKILEIAKDHPYFSWFLFKTDVFSQLFENNNEFQDKILDIAKDNTNFRSDLFESKEFSSLFRNNDAFQNKILKEAENSTNFSLALFASDTVYKAFIDENNGCFREKILNESLACNKDFLHHLDVAIGSEEDLAIIKKTTFEDCIEAGFVPKIAILTSVVRTDSEFLIFLLRQYQNDVKTPRFTEDLETVIESLLPHSGSSRLCEWYEEKKNKDTNGLEIRAENLYKQMIKTEENTTSPEGRKTFMEKENTYKVPEPLTRILGEGNEGCVISQTKYPDTITKLSKREVARDSSELKILHILKDCPYTPTLKEFTFGTKGNLTTTNANIVETTYKFPESKEVVSFTMTKCPGITLEDYLISKKSSNTMTDNKKIAKAIVEAIKSIHEKGVSHKDLHCGNILISDENGEIKISIIDFGYSTYEPLGITMNEIEIDATCLINQLSEYKPLKSILQQELKQYKAECTPPIS